MDETGSAERLAALREHIVAARASSRGVPGWRGALKRLIRRWYAGGKRFDLLELIACPICRGDLAPSAERTRLTCSSCHRAFPLIEGVPVLVPNAGRVEPL